MRSFLKGFSLSLWVAYRVRDGIDEPNDKNFFEQKQFFLWFFCKIMSFSRNTRFACFFRSILWLSMTLLFVFLVYFMYFNRRIGLCYVCCLLLSVMRICLEYKFSSISNSNHVFPGYRWGHNEFFLEKTEIQIF